LYADARYEKVREAGQVRDAAVLVATGISPEGERQVLGVSVSLSEHETHSHKGTLRSGSPFSKVYGIVVCME